MWYELKLKVIKQDNKGNDKEVSESYVCDVELFAEAEQKGLELYNGESDVVSIKRSNIREFVNKHTENSDDKVFKATIEDIFIDEKDGSEKSLKYHVAVWARDVREATLRTEEYMKQGLNDMSLVSITKTKLLDII